MSKRKLAAIMFTDIVGYTSLMGSDERKAVELLRQNRSIHKKYIKQYSGELLKEMGDGMLASFPTTSDAVYCAGAIQKASQEIEGLALRMGIHHGEVLVDKNDIYGDGVNVASRIEGLAQPAEILVSEPVYNNVKNRSGITGELKDEFELKNVDRPVRVYSVRIEQFPKAGTVQKPKYRKEIVIGVVAASLLALLFIINPFKGSNTQASGNEVADIEKSIAVIPFWNDSPDPDNQYFCNGMEEEIRIHLLKISALRIESRQSVEKYRENPEKDVITIGEELGVAYIVEGSARKIADNVRLTIQLINAKTGDHIWGDTYDGDFTAHILEFQSNTAKQVAAALNSIITPEEEERINHIQTNDITAYDYLIKSNYETALYWKTGDVKHLENSNDLIDRALDIDPNYAEAFASKASTHLALGNYDSINYYADQALKIDPNNPAANNRKARYYQISSGQSDLAIQHYLKSLQYNPNSIGNNMFIGQVYCLQKRDIRKGYPYLQKAMELIGKGSESAFNMGSSLIRLGEYRKTEIYARRLIHANGSCRGIWQYNNILISEGNFNKALDLTDSICPLLDCDLMCYDWYIRLYAYLREFKKAEKYINKWETTAGEKMYNPIVGYVYHKLGRTKEAEETFDVYVENNESKANINLYWQGINYGLAQIYAFQNMKHEALQFIEAIGKNVMNIHRFEMMINDPMFDNLRDDPEFKRIMKLMQEEKATVKAQIKEMEERGI